MVKEFFGEAVQKEHTDGGKLVYYLLTDSVSEEFCDLKVYGAEIDRQTCTCTGRVLYEKKIISDLFFDRNEAVRFLGDICKKALLPTDLKYAVKDYVGEKLIKSV